MHEAAAGAGVNRPVGLEAQYNPLIEGVQAEIDNLTTLKDLSVETQSSAAANPGVPGYILVVHMFSTMPDASYSALIK